MTDERFKQIERCIGRSGRGFEPATGLFESVRDDDDGRAEYVARKMHDYDQSFRDA